jgi:uncharacterized protein (TIGR03118 family)
MESAKVRIGHQADRTNSARVAREEVQMHLMRPSKPQGRFGRGLWLRLLAGVVALALAGVLAGGAIAGDGGHRPGFRQINLISDIDGVARITDPNLVNPWGMAAGPTTPLWISDNGADVSSLYTGGVRGSIPQIVPLVVSIPQGAPTGIVFNSTPGFKITMGGVTGPAAFIFDSENGVISAWMRTNPLQTDAVAPVTTPDAVYKGLAIAQSSHGPRIYATNFHAGTIDVFDDSFNPVTLPAGRFTDPNLPGGYAPFGIQELNGELFVTYAQQDQDKHDDVAGPGHGFVDVYSDDGVLLRRLISGGDLNSPWGLVIAPRHFGPFGGDLLVGNFGDGAIHAYDPGSGAEQGQLMNRDGNPIKINGLWALRFGNGVTGTPNDLLFTAGIGDEGHGLFGEIKSKDRDR